MGVRGYLPFENDDADDFVQELEGADGIDLLKDAFSKVTDDDNDYLELRDAVRAVVAAEIVAAIEGNEKEYIPESLWDYIRYQYDVSRTVVADAGRAVKRVLRDSEMMALWEDSKYAADWKDSMKDLIGRLGS